MTLSSLVARLGKGATNNAVWSDMRSSGKRNTPTYAASVGQLHSHALMLLLLSGTDFSRLG